MDQKGSQNDLGFKKKYVYYLVRVNRLEVTLVRARARKYTDTQRAEMNKDMKTCFI